MYTEKIIDQLRAALDYLNSADIAEEHRKTLKRATEATLLDAVEELEKHQSLANDGKPWRDAEVEVLKGVLEKAGPAESWQKERDTIDTAAARLKRSAKIVKRKAIELGYGWAVDYWLMRGRDA